ncbi:hypothetical protein Lal_00018395 [Lupinus albus]|nr:hypothetical protein Lal_00018395 [Lupinus albus]
MRAFQEQGALGLILELEKREILRLEAVSVELEKLPRTKPNPHRGKDKSLIEHLESKMQNELNLVIDLDIESNKEVAGMERLMTNHENPLTEASNEDDNVDNIDTRSDIPGPVADNNDFRYEIPGSHIAAENFIVTEELPNLVVARDMTIVGRLWDEDEEFEEEDEPFTEVLSRGFGNSKTRLVFKNYCLASKPDLVFIAEPMIDFEEVNTSFWFSLRLKSFGFNDRGDFNVVLGAHECRSSILPQRLPYNEFKLFTDARSLVHLVTGGADFTWTNKRRGVDEIEKRLDRCIANEDWMTAWNQLSCYTLPRIASDHHPLLLCFDMGVTPRSSSFKFQKMWLTHTDCHRLVSDVWRVEVVGCPMFVLSKKLRILKKELKVWNV